MFDDPGLGGRKALPADQPDGDEIILVMFVGRGCVQMS